VGAGILPATPASTLRHQAFVSRESAERENPSLPGFKACPPQEGVSPRFAKTPLGRESLPAVGRVGKPARRRRGKRPCYGHNADATHRAQSLPYDTRNRASPDLRVKRVRLFDSPHDQLL